METPFMPKGLSRNKIRNYYLTEDQLLRSDETHIRRMTHSSAMLRQRIIEVRGC